jgi:hypothetical protein
MFSSSSGSGDAPKPRIRHTTSNSTGSGSGSASNGISSQHQSVASPPSNVLPASATIPSHSRGVSASTNIAATIPSNTTVAVGDTKAASIPTSTTDMSSSTSTMSMISMDGYYEIVIKLRNGRNIDKMDALSESDPFVTFKYSNDFHVPYFISPMPLFGHYNSVSCMLYIVCDGIGLVKAALFGPSPRSLKIVKTLFGTKHSPLY